MFSPLLFAQAEPAGVWSVYVLCLHLIFIVAVAWFAHRRPRTRSIKLADGTRIHIVLPMKDADLNQCHQRLVLATQLFGQSVPMQPHVQYEDVAA